MKNCGTHYRLWIPADPAPADPAQSTRVWSAADGRGWFNSSIWQVGFSSVLFPLWPAELVSGLTADTATRQVAQASVKLYANLSCAAVPLPPFQTCVHEGWGGLSVFPAAVRALPAAEDEPNALTATEIADGLEGFVRAYGANASNLLVNQLDRLTERSAPCCSHFLLYCITRFPHRPLLKVFLRVFNIAISCIAILQ